jgi:hypothetical protein
MTNTKIRVHQIKATGTPNDQSFLRGDGVWSKEVNQYKVVLWDTSAGDTIVYDATPAGLAAALAAADVGDTIVFPVGTITADFTIPAGVAIVGSSRQGSIIDGEVTGNHNSSLQEITIRRTANDAK